MKKTRKLYHLNHIGIWPLVSGQFLGKFMAKPMFGSLQNEGGLFEITHFHMNTIIGTQIFHAYKIKEKFMQR